MKEPVGNKKYSAILESSRKLFWKYGFRRVTIEEICREAKTSKMTFYRFFPNKLEVARAVYDVVLENGLVQFRKIIEADTAPSEKIKEMLKLKMEGATDISNEFLSDFYNNPELGLQPYIEERTSALWVEIIGMFRNGQKEGWIRKDMNISFMFLFMQHCTGILTNKDFMKLFDSPQDLVMELASMIVYGITPES
jgi:AcrR family transcriptional regulator